MGIGRRDFLRLFGGMIAGLQANPLSAVALLDDQYINRKLGIAFRKPLGWSFADVKDMGEVRAGQILDLDNPEVARELINATQLPILAIGKEVISADADHFAPGATIFLDRFDLFDTLPEGYQVEVPPIDNAEGDIASCGAILKDFFVVSPPQAVSVSACEAAEYTASFVFEHENMAPTRVRMRTLAISQIPALYTFRMYDSPDSGPAMTFDYTAFIKSIRMV